jgi:uncharacterized protein (TIGR03118 family)
MLLTAQKLALAKLRIIALLTGIAVLLTTSAVAQYDQRNLTGNLAGLAFNTDPHLVNGWGLAFSPSGPLWVSDEGTGFATIYSRFGVLLGSPITIPGASGGQGTPTGQVYNSSSSFVVKEGNNSGPATFIFATLDGTISGWNANVDANNAVIAVNNASKGASYTGLAIALTASGNFLYVADNKNNLVSIYDGNFNFVKSFTDSSIPSGYGPYGVQVIGTTLYVAYANPLHGMPGGYVDTYDLSGGSQHRFISQNGLELPWGVALAPSNFGPMSNDLLVSNLGSGWIGAYNPSTGAFIGNLSNQYGTITIDGLWAIAFGAGSPLNGATNALFFTAGPARYIEGLFGVITGDAIPETTEPILPELIAPDPDLQPSTIPANGDLNPYGVAFVPANFPSGGKASPGDALVSNFNNSSNLQGTGTTIVDVTPTGTVSTFFQGSSGLGLSTALAALQSGFVVVGNVPTMDGTCSTIQQGSLLVIDKNGNQIGSFSDSQLLDGPWDLTYIDSATTPILFVSNVESGTVTRLNLQVQSGNLVIMSKTQIASQYTHRCDPAALVLGPTGLAYVTGTDTLYVASTADNALYAIPNASTRTTDAGTGSVFYTDNTHLHGPLALALAPNGDILISNGDAVNGDPNQPSEIVEISPSARFIAQVSIDSQQGAAFGIALNVKLTKVHLAAVEDVLNAVDIWNVQ